MSIFKAPAGGDAPREARSPPPWPIARNQGHPLPEASPRSSPRGGAPSPRPRAAGARSGAGAGAPASHNGPASPVRGRTGGGGGGAGRASRPASPGCGPRPASPGRGGGGGGAGGADVMPAAAAAATTAPAVLAAPPPFAPAHRVLHVRVPSLGPDDPLLPASPLSPRPLSPRGAGSLLGSPPPSPRLPFSPRGAPGAWSAGGLLLDRDGTRGGYAGSDAGGSDAGGSGGGGGGHGRPSEQQAVCVALHVRPMSEAELEEGCEQLLRVGRDGKEVRSGRGRRGTAGCAQPGT
jgi:translation initiation factor IF-2